MITVLFSKDRAMQCDLAINSLKENCIGEHKVHVLYACSNKRHEESYKTLMNEHPQIFFHKENNFKLDLLELVKDQDYVMFLVDDNIFTNNFNVYHILRLLNAHPESIGFSLRLGVNTTYCYSLDQEQEIPPCVKLADNILMFGWGEAKADFNYPLELSSSIYKVKNILPILNNTDYSNPNGLEWNMACSSPMFKSTKPMLMCYEQSVAFCNPINKTQRVNNNRSGNKSEYSIESLLKLYESGIRIDYKKFNHYVPNGCHEEVELTLDK